MKTLTILVVLTFIVNTPEAHALFGHVEAEKARREHAEQQLDQSQQQLGEQQQLNKEQQRIAEELQHTIGEQQRATTEQSQLTNKWQTTAFVLGICSVALLIVGTAIGSNGRRDAATGK